MSSSSFMPNFRFMLLFRYLAAYAALPTCGDCAICGAFCSSCWCGVATTAGGMCIVICGWGVSLSWSMLGAWVVVMAAAGSTAGAAPVPVVVVRCQLLSLLLTLECCESVVETVESLSTLCVGDVDS